MRRKRNNPAMRIACLLCICAVACLTMAVGVTYARYQYDFPRQSYIFTPAVLGDVSLCGTVSQEWIDMGTLPALPDTWESTESGAKLDFAVANGNVSKFAQRDQSFTVILIAGLSIRQPENITVTLHWQDEKGIAQQLVATATPIEKGSFNYDTYGDGWVYRFCVDGQEQSFLLKGGALSYQNFTVTVAGAVEPTLLDLQIAGRYTN